MTDIKVGDVVTRDCTDCARLDLPHHPGPERFKVVFVNHNRFGRWCFWAMTDSRACSAEQLTKIEEPVVVGNELRLEE